MYRMKLYRVLLLIILASAAVGQETLDPVSPLGQLGSPDWKTRAAAVEQIAKIPGALENAQVRAALISTLDRENQFFRACLRSGWEKTFTAFSIEAYGEYEAELSGLVEQFADHDDTNILRILAQTSFNPDSKFARNLAQQADRLVPFLVQNANSDLNVIRISAVHYIREILHNFKPASLNYPEANLLVQALGRRAGADDDPEVRLAAFGALRDIADVNGDRKVDCSDLAVVKASAGKKHGEPGFDPRADIWFRRAVGAEELAYVSQYLAPGNNCGH